MTQESVSDSGAFKYNEVEETIILVGYNKMKTIVQGNVYIGSYVAICNTHGKN